MYDFPRPTVIEDTRRVCQAFSRKKLKRVCEMHENHFGDAYGMEMKRVFAAPPHDYYFFKDNGSDILAVAHLDTVMPHAGRTANFVETEAGLVIFSGALDDRLGAYIILELLPQLGIQHDILLTVGEESGQSTAQHFEPEKEYNWMIEFDRGGTDVVMYQYDDYETAELVRDAKAVVGDGIFSDISYMDHLEVKGFNWGVGYRDYHGPRSHAYLEDTFSMVTKYLRFHEENKDVYLPHETVDTRDWWDVRYLEEAAPAERVCDRIFGKDHLHEDEGCDAFIKECMEHREDAVEG